MRERLDETISNMSTKFLGVITWISGLLSFTEIFDWTSKIVLFIISAGAGLLAWRNYTLKNKLLQKDLELRDQEIYAKALENKKKAG